MITSFLRTRAPHALLIITAAMALLVAAGTAQAEPTLLAPTTGTTVATVRPTTQWSLPGSDTLRGLEFSSSNAVSATTGDFTAISDFTEYTAIVQTSGTLHTNTDAENLHSGTWYWHALSHDNVANADEWSLVNNFSIPAVVGVTKLTAQARRTGVNGRLKISANTLKIGLRVRVVVGRKQCMNKTFSDDLSRSEINTVLVYSYLCHPGRRLKKGTRIKVTATINGDGAHKTKVMVVRV
ncbi:MAG: hypothetical protein H7123_04045 [Thermoleophilia bacterium]|nr:hypothetical protein [Thermoleophilia bacterium]